MCSGAAIRPGNAEQSHLLLEALCSSFLQEAPGSSLEGFDVIYVDEASPDLDRSLVLKPTECPGHSFAVGPDHGAKVLVAIAGRYADLSGDLYPLALYEKEDQARKPCWHLFESNVLHTSLVVVQAL